MSSAYEISMHNGEQNIGSRVEYLAYELIKNMIDLENPLEVKSAYDELCRGSEREGDNRYIRLCSIVNSYEVKYLNVVKSLKYGDVEEAKEAVVELVNYARNMSNLVMHLYDLNYKQHPDPEVRRRLEQLIEEELG